MAKDLAVVILNYKSSKLTLSLVDILNTYGFSRSIFVVDNHSEDDSANLFSEYAECDKITFIQSTSNKGYSAGNNLGLEAAYHEGYKYGLVLNSDIEIGDDGVFNDMCRCMEGNTNRACVCPRIKSPNGLEIPQRLYRPSAMDFSFGIFSFEKKIQMENARMKGDFPIYRAHGCCMMVDLYKMAEIGWFDESTFLYFEESILAERMLEKGYLTYCCGSSTITHNHSVVTKTFLNKWQMIKIYAKSARIYMGKYRKWQFPIIQFCVAIKSLSMLKGWLK